MQSKGVDVRHKLPYPDYDVVTGPFWIVIAGPDMLYRFSFLFIREDERRYKIDVYTNAAHTYLVYAHGHNKYRRYTMIGILEKRNAGDLSFFWTAVVDELTTRGMV